MSTDLSRIPTSISRDDYVKAFRDLGVEAKNLKMLEFRPDGVYAVVYATRPDGTKILDNDGFAKHRIYIPVDDGEPDEMARNIHTAAVTEHHVTADVLLDEEPALTAVSTDKGGRHYVTGPIDVNARTAAQLGVATDDVAAYIKMSNDLAGRSRRVQGQEGAA